MFSTVVSGGTSHPAETITSIAFPQAPGSSKKSIEAFSRFFSQKTGRLFSRHLNEIRIARACVALQLEEKPIIEIAFEAGFNNLSNFNRRFRETMHLAPGNYRRMVDHKAPTSTPPGR
jgi:transcriptional regulator GlxA family with amidase domain